MTANAEPSSNVIVLQPKLELIASTENELPLTGKALTVRARRELMDFINGQYAVVRHAGKVMVLTFETLEHKVGRATYTRAVPTFYSFADFRNLLMNQTVRIGTSRDGFEDIPVGKWWLLQEDRRQFDGLVYRPGDARSVINNRFNLWRGWGVEPKPGDWSLMRDHIFLVMAAGDEERFSYIVNWLAWTVQNPDQRAEVALVFRGKKGAGKGTLGGAMMRLFGPHARHISSAGQLIGKHNAHFRDCSFSFVDEALWPGDRSAEGELKRLITEPTLLIEAKFQDAIEVPNMLHVMMASNEDWVVPTSGGERRFVLCEVSDLHMQDENWFGPLYEQLENGGLGAMLHDLLTHDLGDWHPRQLPEDTGLLDQQRQSLQPLDAWICGLLESGRLAGCSLKYPNRAVSNGYDREVDVGEYARLVRQPGLFDQAKAAVPKLRNFTSDHQLGAHLASIGCKNVKVGGRRGWAFPPLGEMRRTWEQQFGGWHWHEPGLCEWQAEPEFEDDGDDSPPLNDSERARAAELERERKAQEKRRAAEAPRPLTQPRKYEEWAKNHK